MTIDVEIFSKDININNSNCSLQLWDFGGQERFRFMLDIFVHGAQGALLLFDLTGNLMSFYKLEDWVKMVRKYNPTLPILLVGSKQDLEEYISISDEDAQTVKEKFDCIDFIKVSSKSGFNIENIFKNITEELINTKSFNQVGPKIESIY